MRLLGLFCHEHGWRPAPHLRQAPLFPLGLVALWNNVAGDAGGKQFATDHVPPAASAVATVGASMADWGPALVLTHPSPAAPKAQPHQSLAFRRMTLVSERSRGGGPPELKAEEVCRLALPGLAVRAATIRASVRQL